MIAPDITIVHPWVYRRIRELEEAESNKSLDELLEQAYREYFEMRKNEHS